MTAKTKATGAGPGEFLAAIADPARRADCKALAALMKKATGEPARMWGGSIVGFGSYHYKYASGHEGDSCLVGFAPRKSDIVLYVGSTFPGRNALLGKLGKHKTGGGCLYVRTLVDVDRGVLERLVASAVKARRAQVKDR